MRKLLLACSLLFGLVSGATAQTNCNVPSYFPATPIVSVVTEGSHILKAAPGCLIAVYATVSVPGYILVLDSTIVPADGAVTPIECIQTGTGTSFINFAPQPPEFYDTGIVIVFSTTGCFTKTISATAFFHALIQ